MPPQPAIGEHALDAGAVFVGRAASLQEGGVDKFDVETAVLYRLGRVGDLHQLARGGLGIGRTGGRRRTSCFCYWWRGDHLQSVLLNHFVRYFVKRDNLSLGTGKRNSLCLVIWVVLDIALRCHFIDDRVVGC